jgi:hypothetical protein
MLGTKDIKELILEIKALNLENLWLLDEITSITISLVDIRLLFWVIRTTASKTLVKKTKKVNFIFEFFFVYF